MLEHLNAVNDVKILSVTDEAFASYGPGGDRGGFCRDDRLYGGKHLHPGKRQYLPGLGSAAGSAAAAQTVQQVLYGDMPIQVGYCNGRNTTYNGFEYHKGSEINVAVTDFMLVLGHSWLIQDNTYRVEDAQPFFCPNGHGH